LTTVKTWVCATVCNFILSQKKKKSFKIQKIFYYLIYSIRFETWNNNTTHRYQYLSESVDSGYYKKCRFLVQHLKLRLQLLILVSFSFIQIWDFKYLGYINLDNSRSDRGDARRSCTRAHTLQRHDERVLLMT